VETRISFFLHALAQLVSGFFKYVVHRAGFPRMNPENCNDEN
jgi:hypothetical protein